MDIFTNSKQKELYKLYFLVLDEILKSIIKMMTKTQFKIMSLFVSKITKKFSLQGAGKELSMHQALAYRASRLLIEKKLIISNEIICII